MKQELITLFERDLNKMAEEVKTYKEESQLWVVKGEIKNSAGNLCFHLLGNLNHFIGAILGNTGYGATTLHPGVAEHSETAACGVLAASRSY